MIVTRTVSIVAESEMEENRPRRWAIVLLFLFFSSSSAAYWCSFGPVASQAATYYSVDERLINLFSLSFLIVYFPTANLTSWLLSKSLYWTLFGCNVINAVGGVVKWLVGRNFALALCAQFVLATVNCTALVAISSVAETWFPPQEKLLSTAIGSLANCLGPGLGIALPLFLPDIPSILLATASFATFICLLYVLLARKDPPRTDHSIHRSNLVNYLKQWQKVGLMALCGAAVGTSFALMSLTQQILSDSGYDTDQCSVAGVSFIAGGAVGGLIAAALEAKSASYTLPLRIFLIISLVTVVLLCVFLQSYLAVLVLMCAFGMGFMGLIPLAVRLGVEAAFPLDESVPTNLLYASAELWGLVLTYPILFFQQGTGVSGMWGIALCCWVFLLPLLLVKEPERTTSLIASPSIKELLRN